MLDKLKQTSKHTIIYSLGNLANKISGIILLPLYTKYLTLADYGRYSILEISLLLLIAVVGFRLPIAMLRICSSEKKEENVKSVIFTTYLMVIPFVSLIFFLLFINSEYFSLLLFDGIEFKNCIQILFVSMFFSILNEILFDFERKLFFMQLQQV